VVNSSGLPVEEWSISTYVIMLHQMVALVDELTLTTGVTGVPGKGRHLVLCHCPSNKKEEGNTRPPLVQLGALALSPSPSNLPIDSDDLARSLPL
jgi:hypothetical protein